MAEDQALLPRTRATGVFERRVSRALAPHVADDAPVVVACSGGPDSLAALVAVARTHRGAVTAAHFDHRLRPAVEVAGEREIVAAVAARLRVACVTGRASRPPRDRGEGAAREARYRWLARVCRAAGAAQCVTGHTLDDQAETVLLRLARGTGLGGVAGMAPGAPWPTATRGRGALQLVRPLLRTSRADVERYLAALGVVAARDPSNDTLDYARNRVRRRILPELRALNPRVAEQIAAFADLARADEQALEEWARTALDGSLRPAPDPGTIAIDRSRLMALPEAVAARVLRHAAARLGLSLERTQIGALLRATRGGGGAVTLDGGGSGRREGGTLVLRPAGRKSGEIGGSG